MAAELQREVRSAAWQELCALQRGAEAAADAQLQERLKGLQARRRVGTRRGLVSTPPCSARRLPSGSQGHAAPGSSR